MLTRILFVVFTLCLNVIAASKPASFGTLLGVTDGHTNVYACKLPPGVDPTAMDQNFVDGVYTGIRWQCIYDFDSLIDVDTNESVAITKHPNGYHKPPEHGSLLIWSPYGKMAVFGLVAVVVKDSIWPKGQHYSRHLHVQKNGTSYFIKKYFDKEHIIGWVTINKCSRKLQEQIITSPDKFDSLILASFIVVSGAIGLMIYRRRSHKTSGYTQFNLDPLMAS
ncbi:hypothetical protein THRCLA_00839 [Thraustotheca clavata]|uniref:Secreted protein n=1 Tax=Thraustotheca clavata TaxID=74557 RepID=A0A1W0AA20_9STRA|nr:hypothetical protein THRCLA_00839 [Thraustotheca clavata]